MKYLLIMHGDIEPEVIGPYDTEDQRDNAALAYRAEHGRDDGVFMLSTDDTGVPSVEAYCGGFFAEVDEIG